MCIKVQCHNNLELIEKYHHLIINNVAINFKTLLIGGLNYLQGPAKNNIILN